MDEPRLHVLGCETLSKFASTLEEASQMHVLTPPHSLSPPPAPRREGHGGDALYNSSAGHHAVCGRPRPPLPRHAGPAPRAPAPAVAGAPRALRAEAARAWRPSFVRTPELCTHVRALYARPSFVRTPQHCAHARRSRRQVSPGLRLEIREASLGAVSVLVQTLDSALSEQAPPPTESFKPIIADALVLAKEAPP